jgi:GT2 family glycosyltransferase
MRALEQANADRSHKQQVLIDSQQAEISALHTQLRRWRQQAAEWEVRARSLTEARAELQHTRAELEQTRAERRQQQLYSARLQAIFSEVGGQLHATVGRLRSVAKTKPYRLAHLLRRVERDLIKGNLSEKRRCARWLSRRLIGKQMPVDLSRNPLLDLGEDLSALSRLSDTFPTGQVATIPPVPETVASPVRETVSSPAECGTPAVPDGGCLRESIAGCLREDVAVIFAGVPYDDIGGGQRASQLTRAALERGMRVIYVYAYPRWEAGREVESQVQVDRLTHVRAGELSPRELFIQLPVGSTLLFELPHPQFAQYLDLARQFGLRTVFELIDAWDTSLGGEWFSPDVMAKFVADSDLVAGTAKVLVEDLKRRGRHDARYLPNAANERVFDAHVPHPWPEGYGNERKLLYFGSLYGDWFGWEYIEEAARQNPDAVIYLIGDPPAGRGVPENVRLLGPRKIDDLPAFLAHADAALLPFRPGKVVDSVSPIKVFEYLFLAKRVVATDLPEIHNFPNVEIAASPEDFARLCADRGTPTLSTDGFILRNSWQHRLDLLVPAPTARKTISVIILIHNNREIIGRLLESLDLHGTRYVHEIVVVDNASTDGGAEFVERNYPSVKVVRNPANGCSSGRNLGLLQISGEMVCFLDSDQWLTSSACFEEAQAILHRHAALGAVGWTAGWLNDDLSCGPTVGSLPARGTLSAEYRAQGFRTDIGYLGTGGLVMRGRVMDLLSGFDETYDPTGFEDTDFSLQMRAAGFLLAYRDLTGIRHQPHQTTGATQRDNEAYLQLYYRNAILFRDKWIAFRHLVPARTPMTPEPDES